MKVLGIAESGNQADGTMIVQITSREAEILQAHTDPRLVHLASRLMAVHEAIGKVLDELATKRFICVPCAVVQGIGRVSGGPLSGSCEQCGADTAGYRSHYQFSVDASKSSPG
jgi:hypothetical protein